MIRTEVCRVLLVAIGMTMSGGCSRQEDYPDAPITVVVPWGVGGGTDRVARQMARFLEVELKVPVNVVNATGGRGVTGHSRGLRARPDGYTLTMMTLELNMLHWQDLTDISWREGTPLMSVNEDAAAVFIRADSPWRRPQDVLAAIEASPGRLTASGTASGGAWHLATSVWLDAAGRDPADVKWIPMGSSAAAMQELLSGGLDFVCCSLPEARTLLESKQVRCLGVMSAGRAPGFEDVPTLKEQGYDCSFIGWRGFAVPSGTPADRVDRLVAAMERIVTGETKIEGTGFPQYLESQGFNARWRKTDDFARFLEENDASFGRIYQRSSMVQDSGGRVGPWAFPGLLATALVGLSICLAIGHARASRHLSKVPLTCDGDTAGQRTAGPSQAAIVNVLAVTGCVVAFLAFAETAGFVVVAGASLLTTLLILGNRVATSVAATVLVVPAIYHIFAHVLSVPLPRGWMGW
ncbi:MAG: tripartite tricarboxylate transporter TctB family protein [Planctomycetaceae bacterium]|nr:tripartite tricarboxylate transporter TctB family protein [Planctomycetaceae bacterium]